MMCVPHSSNGDCPLPHPGLDNIAAGGAGCRTSSPGADRGVDGDAGVSSVGEDGAIDMTKEEGRTQQLATVTTVTCSPQAEGVEPVSSQDLPGSVS